MLTLKKLYSKVTTKGIKNMADYKKLFYQSQAIITGLVEELDKLSDLLKKHMLEMEEIVAEDNEELIIKKE